MGCHHEKSLLLLPIAVPLLLLRAMLLVLMLTSVMRVSLRIWLPLAAMWLPLHRGC